MSPFLPHIFFHTNLDGMEKYPYHFFQQYLRWRHEEKGYPEEAGDRGFTFQEGGSHTKAYDCHGIFRAIIGRHTEIPEKIVRQIEKQTGVELH